MSQYQHLLQATAEQREGFIGLSIIGRTLRQGVPKAVYLDFLGQAYHHVKHTAALLALAAARCGAPDVCYQRALFEYIAEERGHEEWILEDIDALGGDAGRVRIDMPRFPCKLMVAYAYDLIERVSPYGLLGMVHVLEGMSVALACKAAAALRQTLQPGSDAGFKYLTTHGELDVEHTRMFQQLIDAFEARHLPVVIDATRDFYRLYGDIFRDIEARHLSVAA